MRLTGYADEAADTLTGQIAATKRLGWHDIELRRVDGTPIYALSEEAFATLAGTLADAGVGVHCLGSTIANGAKRIDDTNDTSLAEAIALVPRMQRLGSSMVRLMSWPVLSGRRCDDQMAAERIAKLKVICQHFTAAGITPVHENCGNWGGLGARFSLELLAAIPGLKLAFDPGNAVRDQDGDAPALADGTQPHLSAWAFYRAVREHIAHVHVKDAVFAADGTSRWCWPGEGHGDVARILVDLLARGYSGWFAIEPHLGTGEHRDLDPAEAKIRTYVEYGLRTEALLARARAALASVGHTTPPM
jgi:sugar phosphate isomerase/epimerase